MFEDIGWTMTFWLMRSRRSTERLIYRLTVFAVNTGLWTSLCALFVIITVRSTAVCIKACALNVFA